MQSRGTPRRAPGLAQRCHNRKLQITNGKFLSHHMHHRHICFPLAVAHGKLVNSDKLVLKIRIVIFVALRL